MADQRTRDAIAADYQTVRDRGDAAAMRRYQNEEACFVLLAILGRLAADERRFVHGIALKGGILMAGELHSARSSADIDATTGRGKRVDPDQRRRRTIRGALSAPACRARHPTGCRIRVLPSGRSVRRYTSRGPPHASPLPRPDRPIQGSARD